MSEENRPTPSFDIEAERSKYTELAEFQALQARVPDALAMITSSLGEQGLRGQALTDYWDTIGQGQGGFYDSIRRDGCSSCGSYTPGCCDGCG